MDRPVLNPSIVLELDSPPPKKGGLKVGLARVWQIAWRVLLFEPLGVFRRQRVKVSDGGPLHRFCRALVYRLIFVPMLVVLVGAVMVFNATHPPIVTPTTDPQSLGVYHDPVSFLAEDGVRLEAWLIPVLDARRVLAEKEEALRKKSPAVVLVHDFGATREQMLPLVRPLHDAGFVVLVLSLRGSDSHVPAGQTFGLNESGDVRAAIEVLRHRPAVDPDRIALLGIGTGATAALLAAQKDPAIAALVLDNPLKGSDEILSRIGPAQWWLRWMRPMCKWTFDVAYSVDADEVDLRQLQQTMRSRPCLMLDNGKGGMAGLRNSVVDQVVDFLRARMPKEQAVAGADRSEAIAR